MFCAHAFFLYSATVSPFIEREDKLVKYIIFAYFGTVFAEPKMIRFQNSDSDLDLGQHIAHVFCGKQLDFFYSVESVVLKWQCRQCSQSPKTIQSKTVAQTKDNKT